MLRYYVGTDVDVRRISAKMSSDVSMRKQLPSAHMHDLLGLRNAESGKANFQVVALSESGGYWKDLNTE